MTDQFVSDRAAGHARVEFAELLFQEAPDVSAAPQPSSELTAQVQASSLLAIYYELRHGNDVRAAYVRALEEHRAALEEYATRVADVAPLAIPAQMSEPELLPVREPVD
ncbi:hypothetical protein JOF56_005459 [Kibdelosporangium banguiense]|uniref:Uncharacterized protein n=1 Tax=Kibdelosporangium banguiense TaxID=1365924 RepID=A0ABS4TM51_9PSEU|nr:hypothetical protein [Kibdelosporangium banguiense]MBP2325074.1 hypothetical protein [Kibdelosporangium banguiense]